MEFMHLIEVAVAVVAAVGGLKGAEYYRVRRLRSGNPGSGHRSSGSNSLVGLSNGDREFLKGCFKDLEIGRLKSERSLVEVIREEGSKTRTAVYEAHR